MLHLYHQVTNERKTDEMLSETIDKYIEYLQKEIKSECEKNTPLNIYLRLEVLDEETNLKKSIIFEEYNLRP